MKKSSDIRKKFDTYYKELTNQKKIMFQQITEWRNHRVQHIDQYANKMKMSLEDEYINQKQSLEEQCQKLTTEATAQEKQKNKDKLQLLFQQCENLQIELAKLEKFKHPVTFIEVRTRYQQAQTNPNEKNVDRTETNGSLDEFTENNNYGTENPANTTQSTSRKPISASDRPPSQQSPKTSTSLEQDTSRNSGNVATPNVPNEEDMIEKCPLCFMIFPTNMTKRDRAQHINEHYTD